LYLVEDIDDDDEVIIKINRKENLTKKNVF
jgi:hypothetical protein